MVALRLLLDKGADPDAKNNTGRTPLQCIIRENRDGSHDHDGLNSDEHGYHDYEDRNRRHDHDRWDRYDDNGFSDRHYLADRRRLVARYQRCMHFLDGRQNRYRGDRMRYNYDQNTRSRQARYVENYAAVCNSGYAIPANFHFYRLLITHMFCLQTTSGCYF
jgi:hypothetical protein